MTERITIAGLAIDRRLHDFVEAGILSGIGLGADAFWGGFAEILRELRPRNAALLAGCDELQVELDAWRRAHPGRSEPQDEQAEPQVVVPVGDAGLVVDAVNARWGSLYAAVYDSDVVPDEGATARGGSFNPARGARVVALGRDLLDAAAPLKHGSHAGATGYAVHDGRLMVALAERCRVGLLDADAFVGYRGEPDAPSAVLMRHQGLHIEIVLDRDDPVGAIDRAGVRDLVLESAVTTIVDLEESFATVGAADKVLAYSVLRGLFQDATGPAEQRATPFSRLSPDREYTAPDGSALRLPGRSLVLVRHVGIHMHTDAVLDRYGPAIPPGLLDALVATRDGALGVRHQAAAARFGGGRLHDRAVPPGRVGARAAGAHDQGRRDGRGAPRGRRRRPRRGRGPDRLHRHRVPRPLRRRDPQLGPRRPSLSGSMRSSS